MMHQAVGACVGVLHSAVMVGLLVSASAASYSQQPVRPLGALGRIAFEVNRGQSDPRVKYISRTPGGTLFLTANAATLSLSAPSGERNARRTDTGSTRLAAPAPAARSVLRLRLVGANRAPRVRGEGLLPGKVNYLIGKDKTKWRTNVALYRKVRYTQVYRGVDLVYYGGAGTTGSERLEYDFIVRPGADPGDIRLAFDGASALRTEKATGDLIAATGAGDVRWRAPYAYQQVGGKRVRVAARYALSSSASRLQHNRQTRTTNDRRPSRFVSFHLARYDASRPIIIDPVLEYGTYLGGSGVDWGKDANCGIAVDSAGCAYVTGQTSSTNFPATPGAIQSSHAGGEYDVFVAKLNASGSALVYATYLGGASDDSGGGIALDGAGCVYVAGTTYSTNFPTTAGALQTSMVGWIKAFVTKLDSSGGLVYSTYLGGSSGEFAYGLAVDTGGCAYVTGVTTSSDFPTPSGAYGTMRGDFDAYVAKLNAAGSALIYGTYLGGSGQETALSIALDGAGCAYVTGWTGSADFPTQGAAFPSYRGGSLDAFLTKVSASGSALVYSTYLGGSDFDNACGVAVDGAGCAYVTGYTASTDLPTPGGAYPTHAGGYYDAYVVKMSASGSGLVYGTYLGGSSYADVGHAIAVDSVGCAYINGDTTASDFPTPDGLFTTMTGVSEAFLAKLDATGGQLLVGTYLGGGGTEYGNGVALDGAGGVYVTGATTSTNFPTPGGAFTSNSGEWDVVVAKFGFGAPTILTAANVSGSIGAVITLSAALTLARDGTPIAGATLAFKVDGAAAGSATTDDLGAACLDYWVPEGAGPAGRTITVSYAGDVTHADSTGSAVLTVTQAATTLMVDDVSGAIGETVVVSATLLRNTDVEPVAGRTVTLNVDGTDIDTPTTDAFGFVAIDYDLLAVLGAGGKVITATFAGDACYGASTGTGVLNVAEAETTVTVADVTGSIGETIALRATLRRAVDGLTLSGKTLSFSVAGTSVGAADTDVAGEATVAYTVTEVVGDETLSVTFAGDGAYAAGTGTATLTVEPAPTNLSVVDTAGVIGDTVTLTATLTRATDDAPLGGRTVEFTVEGASAGSGTTDASGVAAVSLTITEAVGTGAKSIGASFAGDSLHTSCAGSGILTVGKSDVIVGVDAKSGSIGELIALTAIVERAGDGAPLSGKSVEFSVEGAVVGSSTTDASGVASVAYTIPESLGTGIKTIGAAFAGDDLYHAGTGSNQFTVSEGATVVTVADRSGAIGAVVALSAALTLAADGGPVAGRSLAFEIDGTSVGSATTDASGNGALPYLIPEGAGAGSRTIEAAFAGDGSYSSASGTGVLTVSATDSVLTVYDTSGAIGETVVLAALLSRATDDEPIAGRTVTISVSGTEVGSSVTDAWGEAALEFGVLPAMGVGDAPILASFAGDAAYGPTAGAGVLTVTKAAVVVTVADVAAPYMDTVALRARLSRATDGAPLAGQVLSFAVDGTAVGDGTTDAAGEATCSYVVILPVGSAPIAVSFAGDALHDAGSGAGTLTVERADTAMAVASVSGHIGETVTLSATLTRTSDGGSIAGRSVSFTVWSVNQGSAVTDVTGVASLDITIPYGTLIGDAQITAEFAGDAQYWQKTGYGTLAVVKHATTLVVDHVTGTLGSSVDLRATLTETDTGSGLGGKPVGFTVWSVNLGNASTDPSGVATLLYAIPAGLGEGDTPITAEFPGDTVYGPSTGHGTLSVKANTTMTVLDRSGVITTAAILRAYLYRQPGGATLSGKTVGFSIDGTSVGSATTDATGRASLTWTIDCTPGTHTITGEFAGDSLYDASSASGTLTATVVTTKVYVPARTGRIKLQAVLRAFLFTLTNVAIPGKTLAVKVDGTLVGSKTTDSSGRVEFYYTVPEGAGAGARVIRGEWAGNAGYTASAGTGTLTVTQGDLYIWLYVRSGKVGTSHPLKAYVRSLPDYAIQPGRAFTFRVNGTDVGSTTVAATGWAIVNWSIPVGEPTGAHTASAVFAGDAWYLAQTKSAAFNVVP